MGSITAAECAHDDGLEVGRVDDVSYEVLANAREEREDDDVVIQPEVGRHGLAPVGLQYSLAVIADVDTSIGQVRIVERLEGVELVCTLLGSAIASQQMAVEVYAHLGNQCVPLVITGCSNLNRCNQVLLPVRAQQSDGQLRTSKYNRLSQVFHHI